MIAISILKFITLVMSIVGLIVFSILPINFFNNCPQNNDPSCSTIINRPFNYAILGLGIASTLLAGLFIAYLLTLLNGGCFGRYKKKSNSSFNRPNQDIYPHEKPNQYDPNRDDYYYQQDQYSQRPDNFFEQPRNYQYY